MLMNRLNCHKSVSIFSETGQAIETGSRAALIAVALGLITPLALGCQPDTVPDAYPVAGRVTVNGQPLTTGAVIFMSETAPPAQGEIRENGAFRLTSGDQVDGVAAGHYRVAIIALDATTKGNAESRNPDAVVPSLVPQRYTSIATSKLDYEVKPVELNEPHFELLSP